LRTRARPPRSFPGRSCRTSAAGLVDEPSRLAAHAQLDDDEVRAVERLVAGRRAHDPGGGVGLVGHPVREAADDLQPLRVDVVEHELVDRQPVVAADEALDELRRVRAATAHDRDLDAHAASDHLLGVRA
jgi:hypothetical protein